MAQCNPRKPRKHDVKRLIRTPRGLVVGEIVYLTDGGMGLAVKRKGKTDTVPLKDLLAQMPQIKIA